MATLYILTGPPGVGKSTVSQKLAESLSKSVLIEGDDIYHQVLSSYVAPWKEGNHLSVFWRVCFSTITEYLKEGYDVVFNYIIAPDDLKKIQEQFPNQEKKFIVLMVGEESLMKRDLERTEEDRMGERCLVLLKEFQQYSYPKDYFFYTDSVSIDDCVSEIIENTKFNCE